MRSWKGNKQKRAKLFSLGRKGPQGSFLCSWEIFMFFLKIQGNFKDSCKDAKYSYLYSPSFLIALQLSFSRRMGANSSTSREWPYIQPPCDGAAMGQEAQQGSPISHSSDWAAARPSPACSWDGTCPGHIWSVVVPTGHFGWTLESIDIVSTCLSKGRAPNIGPGLRK